MFCLAGIGAHLSGFVQAAKESPRLVVIDGCQVGCALAILKHIQVKPSAYVVLTAEGIEKSKEVALDADRDGALNLIKEFLKRRERQKNAGLKSHLEG